MEFTELKYSEKHAELGQVKAPICGFIYFDEGMQIPFRQANAAQMLYNPTKTWYSG